MAGCIFSSVNVYLVDCSPSSSGGMCDFVVATLCRVSMFPVCRVDPNALAMYVIAAEGN